jgi:ABC-2 type transport system permease protein
MRGLPLDFIVAISWISATAGRLAKSPEAAGGFTFFMMFLPYPSSAFGPIDTVPGWLHGFAEHQPVTPVIESLRGYCWTVLCALRLGRAGLMCGDPGGDAGGVGGAVQETDGVSRETRPAPEDPRHPCTNPSMPLGI